MKNYKKFLFLIFTCFISVKCIDIKLSLGKELENSAGTYPLIVTLKEPLMAESNAIDLFCVIDLSGSMKGARLKNVQDALNKIIDALYKNDRLSLISFGDKGHTLTQLEYLNDDEKAR